MKSAHNPALLAMVACGVAMLTVGAAAQKGKGGQADTPVTSTLLGSTTTYRIQSDRPSDGVYVTLSGSKDKVDSRLMTSAECCRDWNLGTVNSTTRSILVDFRDPVVGATLPPPFEWGLVHGGLRTKCYQVSTSLPEMAVGDVEHCPLQLHFGTPDSSNSYWLVVMDDTDEPGTDSARVECIAVDGTGKCNEWTITPRDGVKNVARLQKRSFKGSTEDHGDFYMSFSILVTNP